MTKSLGRTTGTSRELPQGHGETVLVAEDEDLVREVIGRMLENNGYRVLTAADGEQSVARYAEHRDVVAAVLTDLMMPVMDGVTAIRALQKINPEVLIIVATGIGSHPEVPALKGLNVRHYLSKPFTLEALLRKMQEVLGEHSDSPHDRLSDVLDGNAGPVRSCSPPIG